MGGELHGWLSRRCRVLLMPLVAGLTDLSNLWRQWWRWWQWPHNHYWCYTLSVHPMDKAYIRRRQTNVLRRHDGLE